MLDHPSDANFANIVCYNFSKNFLITKCDINNVTHIFGHNIISTEGKTTVPYQLRDLNKNIIIRADILIVDGNSSVVGRLWGIYFLTQQHVLMRTSSILFNAANNIFHF